MWTCYHYRQGGGWGGGTSSRRCRFCLCPEPPPKGVPNGNKDDTLPPPISADFFAPLLPACSLGAAGCPLGRLLQVLVEGAARKNLPAEARAPGAAKSAAAVRALTGRTDTNKRLVFSDLEAPASAPPLAAGDYCEVEVRAATGHTLRGAAVRRVADPFAWSPDGKSWDGQ